MGMASYYSWIALGCTDCQPRSWIGYFGWIGGNIWVVLCWVGLYFGVKNWRGLQAQTQATLQAESVAWVCERKDTLSGLFWMLGLLALLYRTRLGLATRAVSQQSVAARLCGIRVERVNAMTFVITGLLGGIAGALIGASVGALSPLLTTPLTVKGLIVTVIGGLGSIPGAIVAGLLVGGLENVFQQFRGVTERDLYVMLLLFAFLVFRPGGLFAPKGGRD